MLSHFSWWERSAKGGICRIRRQSGAFSLTSLFKIPFILPQAQWSVQLLSGRAFTYALVRLALLGGFWWGFLRVFPFSRQSSRSFVSFSRLDPGNLASWRSARGSLGKREGGFASPFAFVVQSPPFADQMRSSLSL